MSRIIDFPSGVPIRRYEPLSGPRSINSGSTESQESYVQTSAGVFGLWRFQFGITPISGPVFRAYRGFVTAMHGGANATVIRIIDYDKLTYDKMGVTITGDQEINGVRWAGAIYWKNKKTWTVGVPYLENPTAVAKGDSIVRLPSDYWGHVLEVGDWFGYGPDHYGLYVVTQVIAPGEYRIWPPLRKAVITDDLAIMDPPLAMRLESETGANIGRDLSRSDELTLTMIEIEDADLRTYFNW